MTPGSARFTLPTFPTHTHLSTSPKETMTSWVSCAPAVWTKIEPELGVLTTTPRRPQEKKGRGGRGIDDVTVENLKDKTPRDAKAIQ